ncbi:glycine zipper 2TM domain-containing protein [Ramlibacter henchirensis]|uniref:Glycine zipper 2TM domain-containing protein n=1 Tax=Ramlibacter henchirensis TaxID=204072 RepID=A0A4Z0C5P1_9BURK|nr:glycine zipper 2TM domain-containing protein [Ramlibacter henchirensis]TFZ05770.1 glycine zipper 2TM domain-containing protein [Ramlibacter henchirensis]
MRNRIVSIAGATAAAALLAACGSNPTQPVASYPSTPVFPTSSSYPSVPAQSTPSASAPSGTVQSTPAAGVEVGRVTDIQTVQMGATSATNPSVRNAVVGGIIGAVVGNVAGKHINSGDNRTAATVIGAAGGAALGNRMGQRQEPNTASSGAGGPAYRVVVQTDQGAWRTYEVGALGDLRVGDRVRVENGVIYRS